MKTKILAVLVFISSTVSITRGQTASCPFIWEVYDETIGPSESITLRGYVAGTIRDFVVGDPVSAAGHNELIDFANALADGWKRVSSSCNASTQKIQYSGGLTADIIRTNPRNNVLPHADASGLFIAAEDSRYNVSVPDSVLQQANTSATINIRDVMNLEQGQLRKYTSGLSRNQNQRNPVVEGDDISLTNALTTRQIAQDNTQNTVGQTSDLVIQLQDYTPQEVQPTIGDPCPHSTAFPETYISGFNPDSGAAVCTPLPYQFNLN